MVFTSRYEPSGERARNLCSDQLPILDAVRLIGIRTLPPFQVLDVALVIPFVPHRLAVALEGEDVRGDAIEEPAVVRDDHRAAGEVEQRNLERPQRIDIEI